FMAAQACDREGTGDLRIRATCNDYCDKAKECDDNVDEDDCQSRCESDMEDCQSDEQEEALDDLDDCAQDSCNEFLGCTIGAGLQCTFGL
ncbi:MAG: hypothetical protein IAG13_04100, partial [Deltaproteobacteria bacterium]|nr:hypothetical protein [Nannocystaceae bacterium]